MRRVFWVLLGITGVFLLVDFATQSWVAASGDAVIFVFALVMTYLLSR